MRRSADFAAVDLPIGYRHEMARTVGMVFLLAGVMAFAEMEVLARVLAGAEVGMRVLVRLLSDCLRQTHVSGVASRLLLEALPHAVLARRTVITLRRADSSRPAVPSVPSCRVCFCSAPSLVVSPTRLVLSTLDVHALGIPLL